MLEKYRAALLRFLISFFTRPVSRQLVKARIRSNDAPRNVSVHTSGGYGASVYIHYSGSGENSVDMFFYSKDEDDLAISEYLYVHGLLEKR